MASSYVRSRFLSVCVCLGVYEYMLAARFLYHGPSYVPMKDTVVRGMRGEILLKSILKTKDLAILWSHNRQKYPRWLDTIMQSQCRFVWWDVKWQPNPEQFILPLTGYIWNTVEEQVTHKASIQRIERQPSKELADEVIKSWNECNFYFNADSPLLLYLKAKAEKCTLLKLVSLEKLQHPGKLKDFILAKEGRPPKQPPQSFCIVIDPHLL